MRIRAKEDAPAAELRDHRDARAIGRRLVDRAWPAQSIDVEDLGHWPYSCRREATRLLTTGRQTGPGVILPITPLVPLGFERCQLPPVGGQQLQRQSFDLEPLGKGLEHDREASEVGIDGPPGIRKTHGIPVGASEPRRREARRRVEPAKLVETVEPDALRGDRRSVVQHPVQSVDMVGVDMREDKKLERSSIRRDQAERGL